MAFKSVDNKIPQHQLAQTQAQEPTSSPSTGTIIKVSKASIRLNTNTHSLLSQPRQTASIKDVTELLQSGAVAKRQTPPFSIIKSSEIPEKYRITHAFSDPIANFYAGFDKIETVSLIDIMKPDSAYFFENFKYGSAFAHQLFPIEPELNLGFAGVTEQTKNAFKSNPLLGSAQRKVLRKAIHAFGLREINGKITPFRKEGSIPTPLWLTQEQGATQERHLLLHVIKSLYLLKNLDKAKELCLIAESLLAEYGHTPLIPVFKKLRADIEKEIVSPPSQKPRAKLLPPPNPTQLGALNSVYLPFAEAALSQKPTAFDAILAELEKDRVLTEQMALFFEKAGSPSVSPTLPQAVSIASQAELPTSVRPKIQPQLQFNNPLERMHHDLDMLEQKLASSNISVDNSSEEIQQFFNRIKLDFEKMMADAVSFNQYQDVTEKATNIIATVVDYMLIMLANKNEEKATFYDIPAQKREQLFEELVNNFIGFARPYNLFDIERRVQAMIDTQTRPLVLEKRRQRYAQMANKSQVQPAKKPEALDNLNHQPLLQDMLEISSQMLVELEQKMSNANIAISTNIKTLSTAEQIADEKNKISGLFNSIAPDFYKLFIRESLLKKDQGLSSRLTLVLNNIVDLTLRFKELENKRGFFDLPFDTQRQIKNKITTDFANLPYLKNLEKILELTDLALKSLALKA